MILCKLIHECFSFRLRWSFIPGLHKTLFGVGSCHSDESELSPSTCLAQVRTNPWFHRYSWYSIKYLTTAWYILIDSIAFCENRRRLPRPPPVGGSTDSPSGTLNSTSSSMLRTPTASNSSRTSRDISTANASLSQKMNTISTGGSSGGQSAKVK